MQLVIPDAYVGDTALNAKRLVAPQNMWVASGSGASLNYSRVNSQDETRWFNDDFRDRLPADSPWASGTSFRNNSANSEYGQ